MKRFGLGVILATVAVYVFGMLFWGVNPLPYSAWKETKDRDDAAAGFALLEYFPESGTYYLPGEYIEPGTRAQLFDAGPVAFVHILSREGRPQHAVSVLVWGFLLDLVVVTLLALMVKGAALSTYGARVALVALAGLAGVVLIDLGEIVFWHIPWPWMAVHAVYDFLAFVVAGLILARFVRPGTAATA